MIISKCDHCKKEIIGYQSILVQIVNPNEIKQQHLLLGGIVQQEFQASKSELCKECALLLVRWLSHPENELGVI